MKRIAIACLLVFSTSLNAADRKIEELLAAAERPAASTEQADRVLRELSGVWVSHDNSSYPTIVAFNSDNYVFVDNSLARARVSTYRHRKSASRFVDEVRGLIAEIKQMTASGDLDPVAESIVQYLRIALHQTLAIAEDVATRGNTGLTDVGIRLEIMNDVPGVDIEWNKSTITFVYANERLYRIRGKEYIAFDRLADSPDGSDGVFKDSDGRRYASYLESEYSRLFDRCVARERADLDVQECRLFRDKMALFGVKLQPEHVLARYVDFDYPNDTELAFWKQHLTKYGDKVDPLPLLDYCYSDSSPGIRFEQFEQLLAASGYRNTLWRFNFLSNMPAETPRNWTGSQFRTIMPSADVHISAVQGTVFLRDDGILGYYNLYGALFFSPKNRWKYVDGRLALTWNDGGIRSEFKMGSVFSVDGKTNLALAKNANMRLVMGDYALFEYMRDPEVHPHWARLQPQVLARSCDSGNRVKYIPTEPTAEKPPVEWPTHEAHEFPMHWHMRTEMADGSLHPDPKTQAEMLRGTYVILQTPNKLGTNTNDPTDYVFANNATWHVSGSTMSWNWQGWDTFEFALPDQFDGPISTLPNTNKQYRIVITPTDLVRIGGGAVSARASDPARAEQPDDLVPVESKPKLTTTNHRAAVKAETSAPTAAPTEKPAPREEQEPADLVGCWRWSNGPRMIFHADGTANNGPIEATWQQISDKEFEIAWPPIIDTMRLSADGQSFQARNVFGLQFSGTRIGSGTTVVGQWLRSDNVALTIADDGNVVAGNLHARWQSGNGGEILVLWPIVDRALMSANAQSLDITNQFGVVEGVRLAECE